MVDGRTITDEQEIVDVLAKEFIKIPDIGGAPNPTTPLQVPVGHPTLDYVPISEEEVLSAIQRMDQNKPSGITTKSCLVSESFNIIMTQLNSNRTQLD